MSKTQKNKTSQKKTSNTSLLEEQNDLQVRMAGSEKFIRQNRLLLGIGLGLILLVIIGTFGYRYWIDNQEKAAQEASFAALYFLEADSLNLALNGNDSYSGFNEVAKDYPSTKTGNLAQFYSGLILLKQGKFKESITALQKFSSNDLIVQGRAYALIGDNYMELNKYSEASEYYQKAANYKPNEQFTPQYLLKLGLALEKQEKYTEAIVAYDKIINEFYRANTEVTEAKKYKARLEALSSK